MKQGLMMSAMVVCLSGAAFAQESPQVVITETTTVTTPMVETPVVAAPPAHSSGVIASPVAETPAQGVVEEASTVKIMSGGVGKEERNTFDLAERDYSVKLIMVGKDGAYLSNTAISIRNDKNQEIVSHTAKGPFVLVDLEAGTYHLGVLATDGTSKKLTLTAAAGKLSTYHIRFAELDN